MSQDHRGDIDRGTAGLAGDGWIDLSQGANRRPWPMPDLPPDAGDRRMAMDRLVRAAADWFGCAPVQVRPVQVPPGGCPAMRLIPGAGRAAVMAPGCARHAATLRAAGWRVARAGTLEAVEGADLAVLANPGDPDGRDWHPGALAHLAGRVGHLVVDESLADARPDLSLAPALPANALVLRSLGPLWGLRLGFVLAHPALLERLCEAPVDGRALHLAARALADRAWAEDRILYHAEAALRLDRIALAAGWRFAGGTHLFRLYDTGDAAAAQERLARAHIRARRVSPARLRLGIPATPAEWDRLSAALRKN